MSSAWFVIVLAVQTPDSHMHQANPWQLATHGTAFAQYVRTFGTRGTYQFGSVNHLTLETGGPLGGGRLRVRVMGSAEPLTLTARGAPQLLQTSFPSDEGIVTDHAHANRWIMELAVQYDRALGRGGRDTISLYVAPVGAAALGPPVYFHRPSAAANPVMPLGHHSQDDKHANFGVVALGVARGPVRVEGSLFNAREPDDIATVFDYRAARLDAYGTRITVAPWTSWSLSASYGYVPGATGGHAHVAEHRYGAAALYAKDGWALSLVYGANRAFGESPRHSLLVEGARASAAAHAVFGRVEFVRRSAEELSLVGSIGPVQSIGAVQVGYARRVTAWSGLNTRVGVYGTMNVVPRELMPFYGGRAPLTIAAFWQVL